MLACNDTVTHRMLEVDIATCGTCDWTCRLAEACLLLLLAGGGLTCCELLRLPFLRVTCLVSCLAAAQAAACCSSSSKSVGCAVRQLQPKSSYLVIW